MARIPSIRIHTKGYFFIRIEGKDHYLGYDKSDAQVKADLLLADYLKRRNLPAPVSVRPQEVMIQELGVRFLLWAKDYYKIDGRDTDVYTRCRLSIQLLIDLFGNCVPSQFTPLALKKVRDAMIDAGLAMSTVNTRTNIVRQCFRWGAENELCGAEIYHALESVRPLQKGRSKAKDPKKVQPVSMEVLEAIMPYLPPTVDDMLLVQILSGMRSGELINLKFEDIDRSNPIWRWELDTHKTERFNKRRVVRFGPEAQRILQPYFDQAGPNPTGYVFSPRRTVELSLQRRRKHGERPYEPFSPTRKRQPGLKYRRDSYRTAIQRACEKAGVQKIFPHMCRHLAGTLARAIAGLDGAQHFLNHSSASVSEIYAQIPDAIADAVAEAIKVDIKPMAADPKNNETT